MFILEDIFTVLKGLENFSIHDMLVRSSSFYGSLTCFGVTMSSAVSKS